MLSLRRFAEKVNSSKGIIFISKLVASLGIPQLVSLRYLLEGKVYFEFTLESLTCIKKETIFGPDHCRLEVFTDGVLEMSLRRNLDEREIWSVNRAYLFTELIKVKLWDEDLIDPDDLIDTVIITAEPCEKCTLSLAGDGVEYQLVYHIGYRLLPKDFDLVQEEISLFEQSFAPGVWFHIVKSALIEDIKITVEKPTNVYQAHTPLCGPTAIVYELVARDAGYGMRPQKKRYVQLCRQLWEAGHIASRTMDISPSKDLRVSQLSSEDDMSPADWMLIASLRDVENVWEDVEPNVNGFEGYTFPGAMKTWIFEILGFDNADYEMCFLSGEIETMQKANDTWNKGGVAFLNIHSNLLKEKSNPHATLIKNPEPASNLPNHWIVFHGEFQLDETTEMIYFKCYSWGKIYTISLKQEVFSEYMFGVVLGER